MKVWQPISTVPIDTPVIVTDGRNRRVAVLQSQKPVWKFEIDQQNINAGINNLQSAPVFFPTHWFALPKLPAKP